MRYARYSALACTRSSPRARQQPGLRASPSLATPVLHPPPSLPPPAGPPLPLPRTASAPGPQPLCPDPPVPRSHPRFPLRSLKKSRPIGIPWRLHFVVIAKQPQTAYRLGSAASPSRAPNPVANLQKPMQKQLRSVRSANTREI